jgi:hypothetical protein
MLRRGLVLVGCLWLAGCAAVFLQTDGFPDKIKKGCGSVEDCEQLMAEAIDRQGRCKDNTMGYIRCEDAHADQRLVQRLLDKQLALRHAAEQKERQLRQDEKDEEERVAQARADAEREAQQKEERAAQEKRLADEAQARQEREQAKAAEDAAEREKRLKYLRMVGPDGRTKIVRACAEERGSEACIDLLAEIGEATGDERETARLAKLNAATRLKDEEATTSSSGSGSSSRSSSGGGSTLQCCDGSISPSCACPGHRGCCSHHGGVCGCR